MTRLPAGRWLLFLLLVPVLLLAVTLRISLDAESRSAPSPGGSGRTPRAEFSEVCAFPGRGAERQRLVVVAVDSLRDETAFDPKLMPWLSAHRERALWGRMQPCVSQLSLLCFRTMFEGAEPLLVTGFHNYTGMSVAADNLIQRLAARGVKVAAVADHAFVSLYQQWLAARTVFEDRPPHVPTRDAFGRLRTFEWLADPALDVIVSHVIDTDATSHRFGIGHPEYVAKFRETDDFLREVAARLGPRDSLLVLGDHGHDARGYHSTGIPSQTAYFASGPLFPPGLRRDTDMATTLFLMGAVVCEPVSDNYQGSFPVDALRLEPGYRSAQRRVAERSEPARAQRSATSPVWWELPGVLGLFAVIALAAHAAGGAERSSRRGLLASLSLVPGLVVASVAVPWAAAVALLASARRALAATRGLSAVLAAAFVFCGAVGASAHLTLVTLQNHVNARWTIAFWCGLGLSILLAATLTSRVLGLRFRHAAGVCAGAGMFLCLAFGPYYYGTSRNLMFGVTWLLLSHAVELRRREPRVLLLCLLAIAPLAPLFSAILKEWQPTYPLLAGLEGTGAAMRWAAAALAFVVLAVTIRERRRVLRLGSLVLVYTLLGLATELGPIAFVNGLLLLVSYVGFSSAAAIVERELDSATARWVLPIGQAAYGFMTFFVLLGALRFANVDYRFALELTPIELGEARAAAVALPIVTAKYVVPIALVLLAGPALRVESLLLVLAKAGCLAAGLVGFELSNRPEARLFVELQTQETALVAVLYMTMLAVFAGSRHAWSARGTAT